MTKGLLPANRRNLGRGIGPGRASVEAEPRQGRGLGQPLLGENLAKAGGIDGGKLNVERVARHGDD